jgi:hypothetical protein
MDDIKLTFSQEMRKAAKTTFDRIWNNYFNVKSTVVLSEKEKQIRERWEFAWKMLCAMYTRRQVVEAITKKFEVESAIAYNDVLNGMRLFSDPRTVTKAAKRALSEEWTLWALKKAKEDGDLDAVDRLIGKYNKLHGLEEQEGESLPDFIKNFKPTQIIIVGSIADLQAQAQQLQEQITHDISFEDGE